VRLAAHQPQYLPWLGYFDKLDRVDLFVLLDTVQYKKNEWQNRNRIRTATGWQWLTVPVHTRFPMALRDVRIDESGGWRRKHREALRVHYGRAPHAGRILPALSALLDEPHEHLATLNARTVEILAGLLGIRTPIVRASELDDLPDGADARLIALCHRFGCGTYVAGRGGQDYMDAGRWRAASIRVEFQEFRHPVHPQMYPGFEANLSAIDLLLNCGAVSIARLREGRTVAA
jgi:hypothetical protein